MSLKVNIGWLKDNLGNRFAPKTLISQIFSNENKPLEDILDENDKKVDSKITAPLSVKVGQQLIVKSVDEYGRPTDWECVDVEIPEQVQADYAQNDETKPDFIKNRPLYVLFEDDVYFPRVSGSMYYFSSELFEDEEIYHVQINDVSFFIKCGGYEYKFQDSKIGDHFILYRDHIYIGYPPDSATHHVKISSLKYKLTDLVKTEDLKEYVKNTDYATSSKAGLVKTNSNCGTSMSGQEIRVYSASQPDINSKSNQYKPIVPYNLDYAVKEGLANSKLTWTDVEKKNARDVLGLFQNKQVDWNQNNSSRTDYIKNRPFYKGMVSIEDYDADGYMCAKLEEGKTYNVLINDVLYSDLICTGSYWYHTGNSRYLVLGGTDIENPDTWEHGFLLYSGSKDNIYAMCKEDSNFNFGIFTSYYEWNGRELTQDDNVSISNGELIFKQLDEEFIPDNIPKVSSASVGQILEVEEVDENGVPTKWKAANQTSRIEYITHNAIENQVINPEDETQTFTLKSVGYLDNKRRRLYKNSYFQLYLDDEEFLINREELVDENESIVTARDKVLFQFRELNVLLDCLVDRKTGLWDFVFKFSDILTASVTVSAYYKQKIYHQLDENLIPSTVPVILSATKGQFLKVKSVDENGKPITWEVSDKPTYTAEEVGALSADTEIPSIEGLATEEDFNAFKDEIDAKFDAFINAEEVAY